MKNLGHDLLLGIIAADSRALSLQNDFILVQQQNKLNQALIPRIRKPKTSKEAYSLPAALTLCTANYLISYPNNINHLLEMYTICIQKGYWITDNSNWNNLPYALKNTLKSFQETKDWQKVKVNNHKMGLTITPFLPILPTIISKNYHERATVLTQYLRPFTQKETDVYAMQLIAEFVYDLIRFQDKYIAYQNLQEACHQLVENEHYQFNYLLDEHSNCTPKTVKNYDGELLKTIQIALHCFMKTSRYKAAVHLALQFKGLSCAHTALVGALAGIYYGYESIPKDWMKELKNINEIKRLAHQYEVNYGKTVQFPHYIPMQKFGVRQLFQLARLTYGNEITPYQKLFLAVDHFDGSTDEFYDFWYPIYANLRFDYGVKKHWINLNDDPITSPNLFEYDFDPNHYLNI